MWTKSCLSLILFFVVHTRKEGFVLWRHFSKLFFSFFFFFFFFVKIHNFVSSFRTKIYSFLGAFVTLFASRFSLLSRKTTTTNLLWTTHSRQHAKPLRSSSKREPRRCCSSVVVFVIVSNVVLVVLKKKRPTGTKARERRTIFIRPKTTTSNSSNGRHPSANRATTTTTTTTTRPFTRGGAPRARGGPVRAPVRHRARFTVRPCDVFTLWDHRRLEFVWIGRRFVESFYIKDFPILTAFFSRSLFLLGLIFSTTTKPLQKHRCHGELRLQIRFENDRVSREKCRV